MLSICIIVMPLLYWWVVNQVIFNSAHACFLKDFKKWACAEVKRKVSEKILFAINIMTTIS